MKDSQKYASDGCETWSDLEISGIKDADLSKAMRKMTKNRRQAPISERTADFFSPKLNDISSKDDVNLMDIAVFGLGKKPRFEPIVHKLGDCIVTIHGSSSCGMATIFDYDIFLFVVSYLVKEMESVKKQASQGEDAHLPPRKIRPPTRELLRFCRKDSNGKYGTKQYQLLEGALERLKSTTIKIEKNGSSKRRAGFFSLIGDVKIISETETGNVSEIEIDIPNWVYDGIVTTNKPSVLTLNPDYFLLNTGYHRFLHRIARKCAGTGKWYMSIEELHDRSGTARPLRSFKSDIKKSIASLEQCPLPDYQVHYQSRRKGDQVIFSHVESIEK